MIHITTFALIRCVGIADESHSPSCIEWIDQIDPRQQQHSPDRVEGTQWLLGRQSEGAIQNYIECLEDWRCQSDYLLHSHNPY